MSAGQRACLIEIWGPGASDSGEPNPAPALIRSVWASLIPVRGSEREVTRERMGVVSYRARLDYIDGQGITETMHVRFEGFIFGITGVLRDFVTRQTIDLELEEQKQGA